VTASRDDREELDRFKRDINLCEFAAARGYKLDRRESSRGSAVMRHPSGDKIVIARALDDQHWTYFSVRDSADNGTVIDFLQRRSSAPLGAVRKELRGWLGTDRPIVPPDAYVPTLVSPERDRAAVERLFEAARPVDNSSYLNSRGIRRETLICDRFRGTFRVDARGNVLFPHRDAQGVTGFESRNHGWTAFAPGGTKTLWFSQTTPQDRRLVLTESGIDALSYHQLQPDPHTRYASTGGTVALDKEKLLGEAIAAMPPGSVAVTAFDADQGGEKLARLAEQLAGTVPVQRHVPPIPKDWNDVLKRQEREYILSLSRRQKGPEL